MTGADLRETRKTAGLSMKQAAELSGTPFRTWQDWEGGKRRVPGIAFAWLELYSYRKTGRKQNGLDETCSGSTGNEGKS